MFYSRQKVLQSVLGSLEPSLLLGFSYSRLILDSVNHGTESKVKPVHVCWNNRKRAVRNVTGQWPSTVNACNVQDLHHSLQAVFADSTWSYRFLQFQLELDNLSEVVD